MEILYIVGKRPERPYSDLLQYNLHHSRSVSDLSKRLVHMSQDVLLFFENFYLESLVLGLEENFIELHISLNQ